MRVLHHLNASDSLSGCSHMLFSLSSFHSIHLSLGVICNHPFVSCCMSLFPRSLPVIPPQYYKWRNQDSERLSYYFKVTQPRSHLKPQESYAMLNTINRLLNQPFTGENGKHAISSPPSYVFWSFHFSIKASLRNCRWFPLGDEMDEIKWHKRRVYGQGEGVR